MVLYIDMKITQPIMVVGIHYPSRHTIALLNPPIGCYIIIGVISPGIDPVKLHCHHTSLRQSGQLSPLVYINVLCFFSFVDLGKICTVKARRIFSIEQEAILVC